MQYILTQTYVTSKGANHPVINFMYLTVGLLFYGSTAVRRSIRRDAVCADDDSIAATNTNNKSHELLSVEDAVFSVFGIVIVDGTHKFPKRELHSPLDCSINVVCHYFGD